MSPIQRLVQRATHGATGARALTSLVLLVGCSVLGASCTEQAVTVPVRSLERSGRVSFVCLAAPGTPPGPGLPLTTCTRAVGDNPSDYRIDEAGKTTLPHLYALTTQTNRGEIAVVDLSAAENSVLDEDPRTPGANFLPVGAQPTDIVSTPGGTATFVAVAEIGRQGIFALPSTRVRPCADCAAPTLTSWPACALPSAPGAMILVNDPPNESGATRAMCDGAYGGTVAPAANETPLANGDLVGVEKVGRQKLLVTLPDLGGFVVIDAQRLLDRNAGTFTDCPIERWVPLDVVEVALPGAGGGGGGAGGGGVCVDPPPPEPGELTAYAPRPSGVAVSGDRLYIGDLEAPVIHAIDLPTPCEPVARPSLLLTSAEDPSRVVTTSRLAASAGLTSDLKRYLYAVDYEDGSTMIFDITDDGGTREPLRRPHPQFNPFQPLDRIKFAAPARDVIIIQRDAPAAHPATGVAPVGTLCDPDPALVPCTTGAQSCDVGTLYRTSADYQSGAGPLKLRGMFAFIMLSSGQIAVIDIDDYDAACRGPTAKSPIFGCDTTSPTGSLPLLTSGEPSCNVVVPNTPRQAVFLLSNDSSGKHQPGIQIYPQLKDKNGTVIPLVDPNNPDDSTLRESPQMRAPVTTGVTLGLAVGGVVQTIDDPTNTLLDPVDGIIETDNGPKHTIVMNFEDPHAQLGDQLWTVTFEGVIPGFGGKFAELLINGPGGEGLVDPNSRFCDAGVQSKAMIREALEAQGGMSPAAIEAFANLHADEVQIVNELPAKDDMHWTTAEGCNFLDCDHTFGSQAVPKEAARDLRIDEAYQDHLVLADSDVTSASGDPSSAKGDELIKCCFPAAAEFRVRVHNEWIVVGEGTGFLHHVIVDPEGKCRNSCDPNDARRNGRVLESPASLSDPPQPGDEVVKDDSPFVFQNPMFRFAITSGRGRDEVTHKPIPSQSVRDYQFGFVTQNSFATLVIPLSTQTTDIQPQAITFVPPTGELAVTDGQLEGLIFVGIESLDAQRQFF